MKDCREDHERARAAEITKIVDEIGDLDRELASVLVPKVLDQIKRLEMLRKQLRDRYDGLQADRFFTACGERFEIILGARKNEKHLSGDGYEIRATGNRPIKVFPRSVKKSPVLRLTEPLDYTVLGR